MKKISLWILLLCGAALAAAWHWGLLSRAPDAHQNREPASGGSSKPSGSGPMGGGGRDLAPVPVVAGIVEERDVPIYLNGIGNVQAFQTVTVRSRVDGQLEKVLFEEGQEVKTGQILAQIDPRPFQAMLDQTQAKRRQDEALLDNARLELKRNQTLLSEKVGTAQQVDTQRAMVAQLEATLKADDAAVEAARLQLEYTNLRSPIEGRTGIRLVDAGNVVRASESQGIVTVTQIKPVSVVFSLPEVHVGVIQAQGAKEKLPVLAVARDSASPSALPTAEGVLTAVDNQIDSATGTIRLKATFPNADQRLWPGQFVNVRLRVAMKRGAIVVPSAVVQRGPQGPFVFVIQEDSTAQVRPIQPGYAEDGRIVIESGLTAGERVVLEGQYRLQKGSKVRVLESKTPAPATAGAPSKSHP